MGIDSKVKKKIKTIVSEENTFSKHFPFIPQTLKGKDQ